jgi:hypothetical protein
MRLVFAFVLLGVLGITPTPSPTPASVAAATTPVGGVSVARHRVRA